MHTCYVPHMQTSTYGSVLRFGNSWTHSTTSYLRDAIVFGDWRFWSLARMMSKQWRSITKPPLAVFKAITTSQWTRCSSWKPHRLPQTALALSPWWSLPSKSIHILTMSSSIVPARWNGKWWVMASFRVWRPVMVFIPLASTVSCCLMRSWTVKAFSDHASMRKHMRSSPPKPRTSLATLFPPRCVKRFWWRSSLAHREHGRLWVSQPPLQWTLRVQPARFRQQRWFVTGWSAKLHSQMLRSKGRWSRSQKVATGAVTNGKWPTWTAGRPTNTESLRWLQSGRRSKCQGLSRLLQWVFGVYVYIYTYIYTCIYI